MHENGGVDAECGLRMLDLSPLHSSQIMSIQLMPLFSCVRHTGKYLITLSRVSF